VGGGGGGGGVGGGGGYGKFTIKVTPVKGLYCVEKKIPTKRKSLALPQKRPLHQRSGHVAGIWRRYVLGGLQKTFETG